MGDHLGVGLGAELVAAGLQALLQGEVVLDDPVDDDVHAVGAVGVRVRVLLADAPVGGPARVPDTGRRGALGDRHGSRASPASFSRSAPRFPTARTASIRSSPISEMPAES